ncbi:CapA family protein [Paratractidigestivibacter sp.]|uniref:CapA family protein n=1 Tax=Paratractidigestivibacter sp. TaxID=2847316 RepID=UPI002AC95FCD|nr:CapA family protein [Paratractidigestivibacter sp.]
MTNANLTRRSFVAALGCGLLAGCSAAKNASTETDASASKEVVYDRGTPEAAAANGVDTATTAPDATVTIGMVGDILVHTYVWKSGVQDDGTRNYDALFDHVRDDIQALDLSMLDQETILGGESLEFSGYPSFNSPQEFADAEVAAGFDVILHANNHVLDRGMTGIESELSYWREHFPDTVVTGIADSAEAAAVVPVIELASHKVAVLNFTQDTNGIDLPSDAPWCTRMLTDEQVDSDFAAAKAAGAEAIIVCPHWGEEYTEGPNDFQREWAQRFIDLGATVIFGNHPHVMQTCEWLEASDGRVVPVYWSLGNFVSTMSRMDSMIGGLARVIIDFSDGDVEVEEARLTPLVTHKIYGPGLTTYKLVDYTEDLAAANAIRNDTGCSGFSRAWCVDFCAGRLGDGFDPETCEFVPAID